MSKSIEIITVNIGDSEAKDESVERTSYGTGIWNNCISSEFPIIETKIEDGIATCEIGQPHLGYTMQARVDMYYSLNGDAKIYNLNGQLCAELYFYEGEETGPCKLYYDSGELYFDGYLEKGSSRGMTGNTRKSISYQITAVNFFSTIFCHFQPFSTIACLATLMAMTGNTRKSIFDHFPPFSTIFGHYLPGYLIVHNKKRAETHGCQFRPIPAMLT